MTRLPEIAATGIPVEGQFRHGEWGGSRGRRLSVGHLIMAVSFGGSSCVDTLAHFRAGPVSGQGAWTIVLACLVVGGVLLRKRYPKQVVRQVLPYAGFLAWSGLSMTWAPPTFAGAQNAVLYLLFGAMVTMSALAASTNPEGTRYVVRRGVLFIDWVALGVVALNLWQSGLPMEGTWWAGPRSVGLLGLIPLSWHLAEWHCGVARALLPVALWMAAIAATLSRTATAASVALLAVVCVMRLRSRPRGAGPGIGLFLISLTAIGCLVSFNSTFRERLFSGDQSITLGSLALNAEGRVALWAAVVSSAVESPVLGKGLGSSETLLCKTFAGKARFEHPHNDYLRLWHDLGAVGLVLFSVAAIGWVVRLMRPWPHAAGDGLRSAQFEVAAALALIGVLVGMLTDNVVVYVFVMAPLGALVGAGLGVEHRQLYCLHQGAR
jgi:O-antigen ligase